MSVEIATAGLYAGPRGGIRSGVIMKEEEKVKPLIIVKKVKYEKNGKMLNDVITIKSIN